MTSATEPKTIDLYGKGIQNEAAALGAITPGMLIERGTNGVQAHSTAGGPATPAFAVEYDLTGGTIDDDYAAGDQVIYRTFAPGSAVYALVAAGAAAIAGNALLQSAGDGTMLTAATDDVAVAQALEAVDNSGGSEVARIKIEIIPAQRTASA